MTFRKQRPLIHSPLCLRCSAPFSAIGSARTADAGQAYEVMDPEFANFVFDELEREIPAFFVNFVNPPANIDDAIVFSVAEIFSALVNVFRVRFC